MADGRTKLLVKNLPPELNKQDKEDLLKLFGASEVVSFDKRGRLQNTAFAEFSSSDVAVSALKRLHQIEILGCRLKAEFADDKHESLANREESRQILNKSSNCGATTKHKNDTNDNSRETEKEDELCDAMAPKLGVHHTFPKHLSYLYPAPTITTLTNIANALATVPRFYTQVLHLMNKMNLPPPFTGPTITPPLPDDTIALTDACVDTCDLQDYASSEESEIESDHETGPNRKRGSEIATGIQEPERKKKRLKPANITMPKPNKQQQQQIVEDAFEQSQQVTLKRIEFKLAKSITSSLNSLAYTPQHTQQAENVTDHDSEVAPSSRGFGVLEPAMDENEASSEEDDGSFISSKDIEVNRLSKEDLSSLPQMKKYEKGKPTNRLYLKNLAKQTSTEDLEFIFRRFIRKCTESQKEKFDIRLMKEGRMKGQAFVIFPSHIEAEAALGSLHGFLLHDKPILIVTAIRKNGRIKRLGWNNIDDASLAMLVDNQEGFPFKKISDDQERWKEEKNLYVESYPVKLTLLSF